MKPPVRFVLSVAIVIVAAVLIVFPFFHYAYAVGVCLLVAHQQVRKPFHEFDLKVYPAWFKWIALAPWILLAVFYCVPVEVKPVMRLLFGLSICAIAFSFSYFDYRKLKKLR